MEQFEAVLAETLLGTFRMGVPVAILFLIGFMMYTRHIHSIDNKNKRR